MEAGSTPAFRTLSRHGRPSAMMDEVGWREETSGKARGSFSDTFGHTVCEGQKPPPR